MFPVRRRLCLALSAGTADRPSTLCSRLDRPCRCECPSRSTPRNLLRHVSQTNSVKHVDQDQISRLGDSNNSCCSDLGESRGHVYHICQQVQDPTRRDSSRPMQQVGGAQFRLLPAFLLAVPVIRMPKSLEQPLSHGIALVHHLEALCLGGMCEKYRKML